MVGQAAQPVALAQQELAAAQSKRRVVGLAGQRHVEIGQRAHPLAALGQKSGAGAERGLQAVVDGEGGVIGALGLVQSAEGFERAAAIVMDGGIVGTQLPGAVERGKGCFMLAQHAEAAGEIDLGADLLGHELGGALQGLARLGEAAELQPRLAKQMLGLPGVGTRLGDLRQQGLGGREVARRGALDGVAGECLKLEVRQRHTRRLASGTPSGNQGAGNQARQNGLAASNFIWPGVRPRSRMVRSSSRAMSRRERARRYHSINSLLGRACFIAPVDQTGAQLSIRLAAGNWKRKSRRSTGRLRIDRRPVSGEWGGPAG